MKTTLSLLALFVLVLSGGYFLMGRSSAPSAPPTAVVTPSATTSNTTGKQTISPPPSSTPPVQKPGTYTAAVVASHSTAQSCWTSINGNVYDLTKWISQHPGGEAPILSICGKDGTQAFQMQHGRSGDTRPQQILTTFKIGTLAS